MMPLLGRHEHKWTVFFVIWLCIVWGHSLMQGEVSSAESAWFLPVFRPLFESFGVTDANDIVFAIRKAAHFSEYAVLMFIATHMVREHARDAIGTWSMTLAIWSLVPTIDESLQLIVPDRGGMLTDVLLDMAGGLFGMLVGYLHVRSASRKPKEHC